MNTAAGPACFHCGSPIPARCRVSLMVDGVSQPMCCAGCQAAASVILAQGLGSFYQFRESANPQPPAPLRDWSSYDREAAQRRFTHLRPDGSREVTVHLEGLHCAACVWLIENSLACLPGVREVCVSLETARAQIHFSWALTPLSALLSAFQRIGFTPRPLSFVSEDGFADSERRIALRRLAVAGLGMMQVMTFAVSMYFGSGHGMAPNLEQLLRYVSLIVATPVVLYAARPFFIGAWRALRARSAGMDVPVAISIGAAYLWSVGATLLGRGTVYFDSAVMFTFFLLVGRYVEMSLRHRAGRQHDCLVRLLPESVLRVSRQGAERVTPDELQPGDHVRVLAGERLAADGLILSGVSEIDESLLTGESNPRLCRPGDSLVAGTLNINGILDVAVTRVGADSTLASVSRLLDRAQAARPPLADLADRVAGWFVAVILLLAVLVGVYWWHVDAARAFPSVLAMLVVTCPCALSLATPAALAAATTRLAGRGVLVTRTRALERLARTDRVIFDKTGTLTRGEPRIARIEILSPRLSQEQCLALAAALESFSTHPIARAFAALTPEAGLGQVAVQPGCGIEGWLNGMRYRIGRAEYVQPGISSPHPSSAEESAQILLLLADSHGLLARFFLADALRADARETLEYLRASGRVAEIASGDRSAVVNACAARLGVTQARGEMSAAGKFEHVRALQSAGHRVLMVGDGVNDAPVLAAADVSAAVGSATDLARVSADIILLGDGLTGLVDSCETSRRMLTIIRENLAWALIYNLTAVPLAAAGLLRPWMAAIGMSISSVLVVLNAVRIGSGRRQRPQAPAALTPPATVNA